MRFARGASTSGRRRRARRNVCLEPLEDRVVLSVNLNANTGPPGSIDLSWTSSSSSSWYQVQSSYNGIDFFTIAKTAASTRTLYSDTGLYYATFYWYRVVAHDPNGGTTFSNVASAYTQAALPDPYPIYADSFDSRAISSAWSFVGGTWQQQGGVLAQNDSSTPGLIKKAILTDQAYPADQQITAKVWAQTWFAGDAARAGVGIYTDPTTGQGFELLFHGDNQVQFLDDGVAWGNAYSFAWSKNTYYWFKLTDQNGVLLGKVWQDGTPEPSSWMFQQSGWSDRSGGDPALDGGAAAPHMGRSTAVFDAVNVTGTIQQPQPFAIGGDPSVNPADFRITTFATGLNYPHSMQQLPDGSILVSTSDPVPGGNYYASTGTLLRLVDANGDGVADGPGEVMYTGLPGTLTALRVAGDLVFVTTSATQSEAIDVLRMGANPSDPYTLVGSINFAFPFSFWEHTTFATVTRPTPGGSAGQYDLFFNIGSEYNDAPDTDKVGVNGLISGTLNGSSIYKVTVQDTGSSVSASSLTQIASGLRNAAGMAFDPTSGDLYFEENGIDFPPDEDEPLSVDRIFTIPADKIGTKVFNFGFPNSYIAYRTGVRVGPSSIPPAVAFQPWPDPFTGSESEGPSEIAFAPAGFPAGLNNGIFTGFHGRFDLGGLANEENPLVFWNRSNGNYFDFIGNNEPNVGHLDGLLSTGTSLFIADLSSNGDLFTPAGTGAGVIYEIQPVASADTSHAASAVHTADAGAQRHGNVGREAPSSDTPVSLGTLSDAGSPLRISLRKTTGASQVEQNARYRPRSQPDPQGISRVPRLRYGMEVNKHGVAPRFPGQ
jgi:glucose/arabinose dehydrogenase